MKNQECQFLLNRSIRTVSGDFEDCGKVTVLQWNILNPIYAEHEKYPKVEDKYLDFQYRREVIKQEIQQFCPDILCLEEVNTDHVDYFNSFLDESSGYRNLYTKRASSANDGILFAAKRETIEIVESIEGKYIDQETQAPQGQVYQIHLLKFLGHSKSSNQRYIMLTMTHLKAKENFKHIRLYQANQLREAMAKSKEQFAERLSISQDDIIEMIVGDLNDHPDSETLTTLKNYHVFDSPFEYYDFTKYYIRKKPEKEMIDYILCSKRDDFKVTKYIDQVSTDSLPSGLPCAEFPSDHIYLFAEFAFVDKA